MSVQRSAFSASVSVSSNTSSTCSRTTPEQLFRMCMNASYSPWRSLMKCSVPFGRLRMACRLMISVNTACCVGNCCESSARYFIDRSRRSCMGWPPSCGLDARRAARHRRVTHTYIRLSVLRPLCAVRQEASRETWRNGENAGGTAGWQSAQLSSTMNVVCSGSAPRARRLPVPERLRAIAEGREDDERTQAR